MCFRTNNKYINIQYKMPDSEEWISATVLGKAGKMTGKNKTWYNVQDHLSNEQKSVDLGRLEWNAIKNLHRDEEVHTTDDVDDTSETTEGFVWKLRHGLYGIKDGVRQFYMSVRDELLSLGLR